MQIYPFFLIHHKKSVFTVVYPWGMQPCGSTTRSQISFRHVCFFLYLCPINIYCLMAATSPDSQIIADLKAGHYKPVYLLTGEENHFIDVVSDYMEEHIVDSSMRDFDQSVVYGRDVDMATVVGLAQAYPIMSPVRLVLVKEAQDIDLKKWEVLVNYLKKPSPQTLLVLCYRHKKLAKNTTVYKAIAKAGVVMDAAKLYENQVPAWIVGQVRADGHSIDPDAAQAMVTLLGSDLGKIRTELSKMYPLLGQKGNITMQLVAEQVGGSKEYNVFELQNAIGRRDVMMAARIVAYFAANPKAAPIQMVIPSLYGYLLKVMFYHQLVDKSMAPGVLGCSPYFVKDYEVAARNYSLGKLATCIGYLYDADLRSKGVRSSGNTTDADLLRELVFKIIH